VSHISSLDGELTAVVADDHALVRSGIKDILRSTGRVGIVAEAENGIEAISLVRQQKPHLLTLDIAMPYAQGIEIYGEVRRWSPETRIVVFTGLTAVGLLSELVAAGVDGLFMKRGDPVHLENGIRLILRGAKVISPDVLELLEDKQTSVELTDRERQILSLIASGCSNKEIAERLGVSLKTVDNHRTNLMRKLDVHSVAELLSYALREGLLDTAAQV
jgi:DNA-binding NarL/FixJ family response regulator